MNKAPSWWRRQDWEFVWVALVFGMIAGLIEGTGHMALQKFDILGGVWYPIIWVAPVFDGLLLGVLCLFLVGGLSFLSDRSRRWKVTVFLLAFAACLPNLALLHERMNRYSLLLLTIGIAATFSRWAGQREQTVVAFCRKSVAGFAVLTLLLCGSIEGGSHLIERNATRNLPAAAASAPNVLLVIVDALRSDHLSTYGYPRSTSPTIDRLASQGATFEHAFSTSSYTLPSHASILTGLYPYEHGVEWLTSKAQETASYPTLPEVLRSVGYRTAAFSGNTFWFTREHGFGRGFLHFDDYFDSVADMFMRTAYGGMVNQIVLRRLGFVDIPARKHAAATNRAVLKWVDNFVDKPFFVAINYMDVHDPYLPPQPYRSKFSKGKNPGGLLNFQIRVPKTLEPEQLQSEIDAYDGAIAYVDEQINQLIAALQQRSSGRDLLVIVTSDHGEQFFEHGGFLHGGQLHRELIQVPLIVWMPRSVPRGVRIDRPVTNAAISATIMDLVGAHEMKFSASSLTRLWRSEASREWPLPLAELKQRDWESESLPVHYGSMRSILSPTYQYIQNDGLPPELYDWMNDLTEKTNLATRSDMQTVVEQFRNNLLKNLFSDHFDERAEFDESQPEH